MRRMAVVIPMTLAILGALTASIPADAQTPQVVVHDGESAPAKAWRHAIEAGDLQALAHMHDAATVAFPPDQTIQRGDAAIMKGYADLFAKYTVYVAVGDAHWVEQPPLVVSWGLTTLTLHPKAGGADVISRTRFTDAAVKTESGWRYLVDHASQPTAK